MAKIPLVDLKAQYESIKPEIDAAIQRVIANTSFIGGKEVSDFENAFAAFQRTQRCVGVASGTAAIYLVLKALGVGPGDEVITTPHTFIATVEPIELLGAKTVFVDIDPQTYNIDPAQIEAAITPRTRVIMPVHLYATDRAGVSRLRRAPSGPSSVTVRANGCTSGSAPGSGRITWSATRLRSRATSTLMWMNGSDCDTTGVERRCCVSDGNRRRPIGCT